MNSIVERMEKEFDNFMKRFSYYSAAYELRRFLVRKDRISSESPYEGSL